MRMKFFRGVITGGILSAAVSLLMSPRKRPEKKGLTGMVKPRKNRLQTQGVMRTVSRTVNDVGKSFNDYIKK